MLGQRSLNIQTFTLLFPLFQVCTWNNWRTRFAATNVNSNAKGKEEKENVQDS